MTKWHKNIITMVILLLVVAFVAIIGILNIPSVSQSVRLTLSTIHIFNIAYLIFFPVSILTFLIMVMKIARKKRDEYPPSLWIDIKPLELDLPVTSIACFALSILCIVVLDILMILGLGNRVRFILFEIEDEPEVRVNGSPADNPQEVMMLLKSLHQLPAHHSHPTGTIQISIISSKHQLVLELARDSERPQEYWVFYPALSAYTQRTHIGGIVTNTFDDY